MKIKKNIKACGIPLVQEGCVDEGCVSLPVQACKYGEVIDHIMCAIELLAADAENDQVAKESIANLSVVLMDLKSNC